MIKKIFYTLTFCWIATVIFSYFLRFPLSNFAQRLSELFFLIVLLLISFEIGNLLLNKFDPSLSAHLKIPFSIGCGLAILSTITFFLGIFGFLYKSVFYILLLILFILPLKNFLSRKNSKISELKFYGTFLTVTFFVFFAVSFVGALTPPTFYDSMVYHLAIPLQYMKNHRIIEIESNIFSNFPQNIEMLYTMAIILCDDILANLIHFVFFPLITLSIYGFLREKYDGKISIFASLIFAITPAVVMLASGTYIDLGITFYLFLSFISLIKWMETSLNKWLVLSGLLCGFSLGIKYTAGISAIIFILIIFYTAVSKKENIFSKIIIFGSSAFLIFLPWLVKNYIFTGNPVFPFYTFGNAPDYIRKYLSHVSQHGTSGFADFVNLPWNITMEGVKFGGGFDIIGPFYLVFLPTLFLIPKTDKLTKISFIYLILYYFFWSVSAKVLRFLIPIFPVAAIVFSGCIFKFINERILTKNIVKIILSAIIISNFAVLVFIQNFISPLPHLFGNITKDDYLSSKVLNPNNFYPAVKFMNETFANNSKTLFVGEARNYYTNFHSVSSSPFDPDLFTYWANDSKTAEELLIKLQHSGFTNLFWSQKEYERLKNGFRPNDFTEQSIKIVNIFKKKYLNLLYENKGLFVYGIKK
ncbi:MAG: glycosyltransferase family 39 protein [Elusimicrobia bacterium]|nr:glycosyltransferase family 39 protein [Elusimicrobiota bacterium]